MMGVMGGGGGGGSGLQTEGQGRTEELGKGQDQKKASLRA